MKAIELYFPVVLLFIMLYMYMVILNFQSVDKTLVCDHSNESYWAVLSCGTVYYAVQGGSSFKSVDETLVVTAEIAHQRESAFWHQTLTWY